MTSSLKAESSRETLANAKFRRRDLAKWPHLLVRAVWELARARLALNGIGPSDIKRLNSDAKSPTYRSSKAPDEDWLVARIGFVVTFASRYLPWRSDCLPQALAARNWLLGHKLTSEIRIGVERAKNGEFGAHAWLMHGDMIVTGGETDRFSVLLGNNRDEED